MTVEQINQTQEPSMAHEEVPDTYITNEDVALDMAYAEHPHRMLAKAATEADLPGVAAEQLAEAEKKGVGAGRTAVRALVAQLGGIDAVDPGEDEVTTRTAPYDTPRQWEVYSPEKVAVMAGPIIHAMAEKFNMHPEDFVVVDGKNDGGEIVKVAVFNGLNGFLVNPDGKFLRDPSEWQHMFRKGADKYYVVEVGDKQFDTRKGLTEVVYRNLVADAQSHGNPLPNTESKVWLTGEQGDDNYAPVAYVDGDKVIVKKMRTFSTEVNFRPAVVIE